MATSRIRTALTLLTGAAVGFLAALLLPQAPVPAPEAVAVRDAAPAGPRPQRAAPGPPAARASLRPSTLAAILRIDSDFEQTVALYQLIDDAAIDALERLIAEADSVPGASDRRAALSILYARYADLDPVAALAFLRKRGGSYAGTELRAVFHAWSRSDLTAAVEGAAALPPEMQAMAGMAILSSRDDIAADAQRDIARRLEIENMLPQIGLQRTMDLVDRDPRAAWQTALAVGDDAQAIGRLSSIAHGWAREDPLAAMEAVMALPNTGMRHQLQRQILHEWGRQNSQEALDWALAQPPSPQRADLTSTALAALAESEPRLALDIAQGLDGRERDDALGRVLSQWASADPEAAARSIEPLTGGNARRSAIATIASSYARQDPLGALQWLGTLDSTEAAQATGMMFSVLAHQDPAQAGSLVGSLAANESRELAVSAVAQAWAHQDPVAGAQWVDALVDDDLRSVATSSLVMNWSSFDRDSALRYVESIPEAGEREAALVSVLQSQHGDLDFAERLFDRLTVREHRELAARNLYLNLREVDPQRAERYRELAGFGREPRIIR
jgi:hypothetical protein